MGVGGAAGHLHAKHEGEAGGLLQQRWQHASVQLTNPLNDHALEGLVDVQPRHLLPEHQFVGRKGHDNVHQCGTGATQESASIGCWCCQEDHSIYWLHNSGGREHHSSALYSGEVPSLPCECLYGCFGSTGGAVALVVAVLVLALALALVLALAVAGLQHSNVPRRRRRSRHCPTHCSAAVVVDGTAMLHMFSPAVVVMFTAHMAEGM